MSGTEEWKDAAPRRRDWLGHVAVGAMACVLTVSIAGSLAYLGVRYFRHREEASKIVEFVASLESRSAEETAALADQLRKRPAIARRVMPTVLQAAVRSGSERRQLSAIRLCRGLLPDERVEDALFRLRLARNETVASEAVDALRLLRPESRAAKRLAACLDVQTPAVVDVACVGLVEAGPEGWSRLRDALPRLSAERRRWLAGLLAEKRPAGAEELIGALAEEASEWPIGRVVGATAPAS